MKIEAVLMYNFLMAFLDCLIFAKVVGEVSDQSYMDFIQRLYIN